MGGTRAFGVRADRVDLGPKSGPTVLSAGFRSAGQLFGTLPGNFYLSETQDCPFGSLRAILGEKCGLSTVPMGSQYTCLQ